MINKRYVRYYIEPLKLVKEKEMEAIVWIFHNVMPWLGIVYLVCILLVYVLGISELRNDFFTGAWDLVGSTLEYSSIAMFVPLIPMFIISWIIEKIMRLCGCKDLHS